MTGQVNLQPLETLRRLFGGDVAEQFRAVFGGCTLHIPLKLDATHPIAKAIGLQCALALVDECGGVKFFIPTGKPAAFRDRLRAAAAEGLSNREIALRLGVTERHVYAQRRRYGIEKSDTRRAAERPRDPATSQPPPEGSSNDR